MRKAVTALVCLVATAPAQIPEQDARNTVIRHTDMHYELPAYQSIAEWLARAVFLRKQILSAAGLLPMPDAGPLKVEVFGRVEREGYTVEKVLLETYPGFYLGGNLYRPRLAGKHPGVASPHGHWNYGRLENSERGSIPARGISLARQGHVVFTYDMVGYNDTMQAPHAWIGGPREALWSISLLGLQLYNSIRAVDFLLSLPDVDANRIAATGASGGGTQTFLLTAVDDRVKIAAPVNMISFIMQGGSVCENAPNLRVGTHNVEIGALMAPRPLLMVSATGDWTRNSIQEEFPAIQSIYRLLRAEDRVEHVQIDAPHNYNKDSREAVYRFFGTRLNMPGPHAEKSYHVEQLGDMLSLYGRQPPPGAVTLPQLTANLMADARRGIEGLRPRDAASLEKARAAFRERLSFSVLASQPAAGDLIEEKNAALASGEMLLLGRRNKGDRIAAAWLEPRRQNPAANPTLLVHPEGVAWVLSSSESNDGIVRAVLNRGGTILGIDAFQCGNSRAPRERGKRYFTTFNQTDDAHRVQDILTALAYLQKRSGREQVNLVGVGMAGIWCYFGRALAGDGVHLTADLAQFRADTDFEYIDKFFIPGLRKAGDFRAAATLLGPGRVLLHNAGPEFPRDWVTESLAALGSSADIREQPVSGPELLDWIAPEPLPAKRAQRKSSNQ